jgi:DNA-binding transcriptional MerR regulator
MVKKGKSTEVMQIGDFAGRARVSVRAIRYYEELGLLKPEAHSAGGFRLYGQENLKRIQVVNFLKELGLTLTEIRDIFLAKKTSGESREAVGFLLNIFSEKLEAVNQRILALNKLKKELGDAIHILHSCENCDHMVLLDSLSCADCARLVPRESVPSTFEVILQ